MRDAMCYFTQVTESLLWSLHECPVLLCEGYLVELQYFRKFHSQSRVINKHMNTDQSSLTSQSARVAYLRFFCLLPFWY